MIKETALSRPLAKALETIMCCIPESMKSVEDGLLDLIAITLTGEKFKRGPKSVKQVEGAESSASYLTMENASSPSQLALALEVVRSLKTDLADFTTGCLIHFLDSEDKEVRKEAALSCAKLIFTSNKPAPVLLVRSTRAPTLPQTNSGNEDAFDAADVVEKLLIVGTADTSASIRHTVISSLDERFDSYLEQPENLKSLFIAVNDETFKVGTSFSTNIPHCF